MIVTGIQHQTTRFSNRGQGPPPHRPAHSTISGRPVNRVHRNTTEILIIFRRSSFHRTLLTRRLHKRIFRRRQRRARTNNRTYDRAQLRRNTTTRGLRTTKFRFTQIRTGRLVITTPHRRTPRAHVNNNQRPTLHTNRRHQVSTSLRRRFLDHHPQHTALRRHFARRLCNSNIFFQRYTK